MEIRQFHWSEAAGWNPAFSASPAPATVAFLFCAREVAERPGWIQSVRQELPGVPVVGCTTGGDICSARVSDESATLSVVTFRHTRVRTSTRQISSPADGREAGRRSIEQLDAHGLRHVFLLSDGLAVNGSDVVAGVNEALPAGVSISGGFAADANRFCKTFVWCDSPPLERSIVAVGFYGERLRVGVSAKGGWGPFGPDRLITRSEKNVLYEVDGRPVLSLYKEYLGEYASQLPAIGLMFPLELRDPAGENRVLRALIAVDETEQSITFAGDVPKGWFCRFMMGDIEDLINGTFSAAQRSLDLLGGKPAELSLVVSCNARRAVLKQRVEEELDAAREVLGAATPLVGFYSYGELAPGGAGKVCELHNETLSITSLSEA